jgi:hypothetical protein
MPSQLAEDQGNLYNHSCTVQFFKCWRPTKWKTYPRIMVENYFWSYSSSQYVVKHEEQFYWCKLSEGWKYGTFYIEKEAFLGMKLSSIIDYFPRVTKHYLRSQKFSFRQ